MLRMVYFCICEETSTYQLGCPGHYDVCVVCDPLCVPAPGGCGSARAGYRPRSQSHFRVWDDPAGFSDRDRGLMAWVSSASSPVDALDVVCGGDDLPDREAGLAGVGAGHSAVGRRLHCECAYPQLSSQPLGSRRFRPPGSAFPRRRVDFVCVLRAELCGRIRPGGPFAGRAIAALRSIPPPHCFPPFRCFAPFRCFPPLLYPGDYRRCFPEIESKHHPNLLPL